MTEENFRFVGQFEYENGKRAFLRIFDDMRVFPSEREITGALKTLVEKSPVIAFTTGHDEREPNNHGERGYGFFAKEPSYRGALTNKGFTIVSTGLNIPVADSIDLLVISDMRQPLSDQEMIHLKDYIECGGNLLLFGEYKRQENMNPVAELLGLKFGDDLLVQPNEAYPADWVASHFTKEIADKIPDLTYPYRQQASIVMASGIGVEQIEDKGFEVIDGLVTSDKGVWNEKQTTNFLNELPVLNAASGESEKAYSMMKYLSRQINGKEQRVFVLGDADWITPAVTQSHRINPALAGTLFEHLTYNRFPVSITQYPPTDNKIIATQEGLECMKKGYLWGVPAVILLLAGIVWFRRRRK